MKNLSTRVVALAAVALLALLGLALIAIVQGRYDLLLLGLIGGAGFALAVAIHQKQASQAAQLRQVVAKVDQLVQIAQGIPRLEDTVAGSPRMLEGSQERQIAETAARFDWLARRHMETSEQLDAFLAELRATIAQPQSQESVGQGTAGSSS